MGALWLGGITGGSVFAYYVVKAARRDDGQISGPEIVGALVAFVVGFWVAGGIAYAFVESS